MRPGISGRYKAMAASVPRRINGPSGRWLERVARCRTSSAPPYSPARANAAKVPESRACQLIQPSAAPTLAASLASPRPKAAGPDDRQDQVEAGQGNRADGRTAQVAKLVPGEGGHGKQHEGPGEGSGGEWVR